MCDCDSIGILAIDLIARMKLGKLSLLINNIMTCLPVDALIQTSGSARIIQFLW
jgi:hypothetical protein